MGMQSGGGVLGEGCKGKAKWGGGVGLFFFKGKGKAKWGWVFWMSWPEGIPPPPLLPLLLLSGLRSWQGGGYPLSGEHKKS